MSRFTLMSCSALAAVVASAVPAMAAITVIHQWDMGASEVAGGNGNVIGQQLPTGGSQTDLVGGPNAVNLSNELGGGGVYTGPIYTSNAAPGCKVAIRFTGDAYESLDSAACIKLHQDFGFQLWVKATDNSDRMIAYNGNPAKNGCGFIQHHGHLEGLLGGVAFIKGPKIIPDQWVNLALVVSRAKTKLYVNARDYASCKSVPKPPSPALDGDGFWIGSQRKIQTAYCGIDDVKIFTFIPGGFAVRDLACADKKR